MFSQPIIAADSVTASGVHDLPAVLPPVQVADSGRIRMGGGCRFRPTVRPTVRPTADDREIVSA